MGQKPGFFLLKKPGLFYFLFLAAFLRTWKYKKNANQNAMAQPALNNTADLLAKEMSFFLPALTRNSTPRSPLRQFPPRSPEYGLVTVGFGLAFRRSHSAWSTSTKPQILEIAVSSKTYPGLK